MNAPIPQEQISIWKNQGEEYSISITFTISHVTILICKNNKIPRKRFERKFAIDELVKISKWFVLFDSIETIVKELLSLINDNKIKLDETVDKISLSFIIKVWNIDKITLDIPQCEIKSSDVIQDICTSINQMNVTLSNIVEQFDVLKGNPQYMEMYNRGQYFNNHKMKIIDEEFMAIIASRISNNNVQLRLIYSTRIDRKTSEEFHKYCDNQSNNLVVIKTSKNIVFGGYTTRAWDKSNQYKSDPDAFLFSDTYKLIYPISDTSKAIYCGKLHGPHFGSSDITTNSTFNDNSVLFASYSEGTNNELNANKNKYIIEEMEVYKVLIQ